jgi:mannosyl-oligosaccharide alpha-1,2-mannosidase
MSKASSVSDLGKDTKSYSDVIKNPSDFKEEKSISDVEKETSISDGESDVERAIGTEDVQPPPYTPTPIKATNRRPLLLKALFAAIGLCLVPIIVAPAVILSQRDEPRYRMIPKLDTQAMTHQQRADAVRNAYQFAWNGYMQHAFPHDQLLPVTNTFSDPRDGWGASAVDGLDTAIIMGLIDPVATILKHISTIDYTRPAPGESISVFETNIRYLGGMLSAYDLLSGPFASFPHDPTSRENLLTQSKKLADALSVAFNTTTGIPDNTLNFDGTNLVRNGSSKANLAEMGSLILEWSRLSTLLNDTKYENLAMRAQQYLLKPMPPQAEIFPGLIGSYLSIENGSLIDQTGGWGGGSDSFYEYLIKAYIYDPIKYSSYKDRWVKAADSTMMYLASHPNTRTDLTFLAGFDGTKGVPQSGHCELIRSAFLKLMNMC